MKNLLLFLSLLCYSFTVLSQSSSTNYIMELSWVYFIDPLERAKENILSGEAEIIGGYSKPGIDHFPGLPRCFVIANSKRNLFRLPDSSEKMTARTTSLVSRFEQFAFKYNTYVYENDKGKNLELCNPS